MNPQTFVKAIRSVVCKGAAKGTIDVIERPPGRRPPKELMDLSQWYARMSSEDRKEIRKVVDLAASQTTYNFLLVLDGLLAIEPSGIKGKLELCYDDGERSVQLNDENSQLSFLFKEPE